MQTITNKRIQWVLAGVSGFLIIGSGLVKISGTGPAPEMATGLGISLATLRVLGGIEVVAGILFLFSRTGILGLLLLASYMGGAIASHVLLGESILIPALLNAFLWITAAVRFPELHQRLLGRR